MMYAVRKLTAEDAEAWARLRHEAVQLHPYAFGAPLPDNLDMLVQSFTRIVMSRSDEAVFGAFMDTVLVGVVEYGVTLQRNNVIKPSCGACTSMCHIAELV